MKEILKKMDNYMTRRDLYIAAGIIAGIFSFGMAITIYMIHIIGGKI